MIAFITLLYCGLIWVIFFKFKLAPFNNTAKVVVSVVGIVGILTLFILMTMYQPYTKSLMVYQNIVQIAAQVSGPVVEVPVKALEPVREGDVLFKVDPQPFEYRVQELKASLDEATADMVLQKTELQRSRKIFKQGAGSARDVDKWQRKFQQAEGAVAKYQAQLEDAKYDLEQTTVYAPTNGFVADLQLRPGSTVAAKSPVIAFVDNSASYAIALVGQNAIRHIAAGNPAEIALVLYPGRTFSASVENVAEASAQQTATGLISGQPDAGLPVGTMVVRLKFGPESKGMELPSGANGVAAIYTDKGKALAIIRKVIVRMYSWMNYLP